MALDIETASSDPTSICEIALVRFVENQPKDTFHSIVQPEFEYLLMEANESIHGITVEEIQAAPLLSELWVEIIDFIGRDVVVAHSATNDINKIIATLEASGVAEPALDIDYLCTKVASQNSPLLQVDSYSIQNLALHFGLTRNTHLRGRTSGIHGALEDSILAGEVAIELASLHGVDSLSSLANHVNISKGKVRDSQLLQGCQKKAFGTGGLLNAQEFSELQSEVREEAMEFDGHSLSGKNVLLTLSLRSMSEAQFVRACALAGAVVKTSVSRKLDILVEGEDPTGKYVTGDTGKSKKARELNASGTASIQILREAEFLAILTPSVFDKAVLGLPVMDSKPESAEKILREKNLEKSRAASAARRAVGEELKKSFLAQPAWSTRQIKAGDKICFTQILDVEEELRLTALVESLGASVTKTVNAALTLLVVADGHQRDSAKLRDALVANVEVTLLSVFQKNNPLLRRRRRWFWSD